MTDPKRPVDLRSDTVTVPTAEMRAAIARAEVGDDCYGEDPTVSLLEEMAADRLGMAAGMLVPSGTMGNLTALLALTRPGDRVVAPDEAHLYLGENGGAAAFGGVVLQTLPIVRGLPTVDVLIEALEPYDDGVPPATVVTIENTHNLSGGTPIEPARVADYIAAATSRSVDVHVDGSRIFNAAVAFGCRPSELVKGARSVTFCLSKGLSCPVGSVLCGDEAVIARARTLRKMLGGGMRQAGMIAAAGVVALDTMVDRLADDHVLARKLASGIHEAAPGAVDLDAVATNIVAVVPAPLGHTAESLVAALAGHGILCFAIDPTLVRFVTHVGVSSADVDRAVEALAAVCR